MKKQFLNEVDNFDMEKFVKENPDEV